MGELPKFYSEKGLDVLGNIPRRQKELTDFSSFAELPENRYFGEFAQIIKNIDARMARYIKGLVAKYASQ